MIQAILLSGLVAGVLDIADALIFSALRGRSPVRVLQYIASGVLGQDSFQGGAATTALGLFLHFVIVTGAAAVFVAAGLQLPSLLRQPFLWGPIYGMVVLIVMNRVVVPLSLVRQAPLTLNAAFINLVFAHIFCVGIPIAFVASRMLLVHRTRHA